MGIADLDNLGHCGGHSQVSEVYLSRSKGFLIERRSQWTFNLPGF